MVKNNLDEVRRGEGSHRQARTPLGPASILISHKMLSKSFCKTQFPHRFVNVFFIKVIVQDELTDLWRSSILPNAFQNILREINSREQPSLNSHWSKEPGTCKQVIRTDSGAPSPGRTEKA